MKTTLLDGPLLLILPRSMDVDAREKAMEESVVSGLYSTINSLREEILTQRSEGRAEILNFTEALTYLRLPEGTLREFVRLRKVPCYKVGRRILFRRKDLDVWFDKQRVVRKQPV